MEKFTEMIIPNQVQTGHEQKNGLIYKNHINEVKENWIVSKDREHNRFQYSSYVMFEEVFDVCRDISVCYLFSPSFPFIF